MSGFRSVILGLAFLSALVHLGYAEYWFQSGAEGGQGSFYNTGASVSIQTVYQNISTGSLAYWVGENLQNGAFLQVGYVIENSSGSYPSHCGISGCSGYEYLEGGVPHWFYEYFPEHYNSSFLGVIGPNTSTVANGSYHRYGFYSSGDTWYFTMDGNVLGSVNLGTGSSGGNGPVAFGELANASSNTQLLLPVIFSNLSAGSQALAYGYSYIGYGVGSRKDLSNFYGVQEIGGRTDYFEVGSGMNLEPNGTQLWKQGYYLTVKSAYGSNFSNVQYGEYNRTAINEPQVIYVDKDVREVFENWAGFGPGSYSGPFNRSTVVMLGNVTEQAEWQTQYYVNVSSSVGAVNGSGWYNLGQAAHYYVASNTVYKNSTSRMAFGGWSTGGNSTNGQVIANEPLNIRANWTQEYLVYASSQIGVVSGNGWYPAGSDAVVSLMNASKNISNAERYSFYSWSNNDSNSSFDYVVKAPLLINASFRYQYLVSFDVTNKNGSSIGGAKLYLNNALVPDSLFLYSNKTYIVDSVYYNGAKMALGTHFSIDSPETVPIAAPLYNVKVVTDDVFGAPVDANLSLEPANGSILSLSTGPSGSVTVYNVPYGKISGVATYLGIEEYVSTEDSGSVKILFVSATDVMVMASAVAASLVIYFASRRHLNSK